MGKGTFFWIFFLRFFTHQASKFENWHSLFKYISLIHDYQRRNIETII